MNKADQIKFNKLINDLNRKSKFSECMYPKKEECSERIIKAHSIQNNRILNKISVDGEVIQIDGNSLVSGNASKIGRRIATTFTGFCGKHDNDVFKSIEENDYDASDYHDFLYAYRTFCREYIVKRKSEKWFTELCNLDAERYSPFLFGVKSAIIYLNEYKKIFDYSLLNKNYSIFKYHAFELDREYLIAVSSGFGLEYDLTGNLIAELDNFGKRVPLLFLNIFPQSGKTYILFSYLKEDEKAYDLFMSQLDTLDNQAFMDVINILICLYCENFVYSPEKWIYLSDFEKKQYIQLYDASIYGKSREDLKVKPNFNLFK